MTDMKLVLDEHVGKVAAFMQDEVPGHKLKLVAHAIAQLADLIWERYSKPQAERFEPFYLERDTVMGAYERSLDRALRQPGASEQPETKSQRLKANEDCGSRSAS